MPDSKYFGIPFGTSGDRSTIPEATQPGGAVSYQQGFGPDYERNPATDPLAKRVPRGGTNEFYYQVTNALRFLQLYGLPEWYQNDDAGNRVSYPLLARVRNGGVAYVSLVANNLATPGTDPASWGVDVSVEATLAEIRALTRDDRLVTPRRLGELAATITQRGIARLATVAETIAGTADTISVTPAGLFAARSEIRAPTTLAWTAPGTYSWTVPANVTRIYIDVTGGGGGGGGQKSNGLASGGGGAGQAEGTKTVTPGQTLTITVGAGGTGGTGSNTAADPTNGTAGGTSSVGSLMSATGGGFGFAAASGVQPNSGGQGAGSNGSVNRAGSGGGTGFASIGGQGGGTYRVSGSPLNSGGQGQSGYGPGGGGSGASGGGANGGAGAPGQVVIQY